MGKMKSRGVMARNGDTPGYIGRMQGCRNRSRKRLLSIDYDIRLFSFFSLFLDGDQTGWLTACLFLSNQGKV